MTALPELRIDRELCAGHGRCFDVAPALFAEDAEGYGQVVAPAPDADALGDARLAVRACPEQAVRLSGVGGAGRAHPPEEI
ncbi:ferredoxin [Streptomyces sp. NPDC058247]|uniref:ferredoxin n=1 Tax=Streptomyces sp. NPDC058247 TaxID=3346401 RepID=UPI0036E62DE0